MKHSRQAQLLLASLCAGATFSSFANNQTDQAYYGFTGLFNIPNAETLKTGEMAIGYNNQLEFRGKYVDGHNFNFTAGLFDGLEVAGKVAASSMNHNLFYSEGKGEIRDLSFNAKYQIPYIPKDWFSLAIGAQDLGGAANNFEAYYVAASKEIGDFRITLGGGTTENATGRLDGAFGGVEWMPFTWLTIAAEHDAQALNAGVKVHVPSEWTGDWVDLTLSGKLYSDVDDNRNEDSAYFGINAKFNVMKNEHRAKAFAAPMPMENAKFIKANSLTKQSYYVNDSENQDTQTSNLEQQVIQLKYALLKDGFENVEVGFNNQEISVIFENHVFNRNELDALGLVLGRIQASMPSELRFTVTMKKFDIQQIQLKGLVASYQAFIENGSLPDLAVNQNDYVERGGLKWVHHGAKNAPYWKPRVSLSPALVTGFATELGVLDYSLALQADVSLPLWQGASIDVSARQHVASSDDYKEGKPFHYYEHKSGVKDILFTQTVKLPFNVYNQTQVGIYNEYYDYYGAKNQSVWQSPQGTHQFSFEAGYFEYKDYSGNRKTYLGGYRYNLSDYDITLSAKAGKFFYGDTGFKLESKFWFGDTAIDLFYQNTDVQMVGIGLNIPLTPRKDYGVTEFGQLTGNKNWRHQIRSRIGDSHNELSFGTAIQIQTNQSIERAYFNQDRLSSGYILNHAERLKEAYTTFK
ncbi:YjbH domain-containing protein [Pseudoalteromonas xiamenensis]